ncbi:hypothetical protein BO82DRAFT_354513 [Aspergillus uvarum CBS 121591]|uniref:Uncharacterized protein n=1 Tax=Aspergillus uvarum CBS 121591 TaxID=1448315 RepID=A0A319C8B5_9EURO|nr:hypothetical protein BO82DRAFT_354513 [Aspergillus uvarum CBS 121591]PYH81484.1 hypothetical protein BO82DRAFT_354513 [Aspergillus uvarum CBS 121591]
MNHHYSSMILAPSSQPPFSSSPFPLADDDPLQQQQQQFDGSYLIGNPVRNEILSLVHQQRFFTGWGDTPQSLFPGYDPGLWRSTSKTPTLGLVWSTQIACRIALKKETRALGVFDFEGAYDDEELSGYRDASQAIEAFGQIIGPINTKSEHEGALLDTTTTTTTATTTTTTTGTSQDEEHEAEIANSDSDTKALEPSDDAALKDEQPATAVPNPAPSSASHQPNTPPDTQPPKSPSTAPNPQAPATPSPADLNPPTIYHHLPSTQRKNPQTVRRTFKVVFAPWTGGGGRGDIHNPRDDQEPQPQQPSTQEEVEFEIWKGGIRGWSPSS